MFLTRIHLDPRCKEARRDLSDPYQLHSTICRAFSEPETRSPVGHFLWRLEPETNHPGYPRILLQSRTVPDWNGIRIKGWLADADKSVNLKERLNLDAVKSGQRFRFRLRANPCVTKNGKRLGLMRTEDQEAWIIRKGELHGFNFPYQTSFDLLESDLNNIDVCISQSQMLTGNQHNGNTIRIFSVMYEGIIAVTEPEDFINALHSGIGHGKAMGLGLLSVVPVL